MNTTGLEGENLSAQRQYSSIFSLETDRYRKNIPFYDRISFFSPLTDRAFLWARRVRICLISRSRIRNIKKTLEPLLKIHKLDS